MLLAQARESKLTRRSSSLARLPVVFASRVAECLLLFVPVLCSQSVLFYLVVAAASCLPSPTTRHWRCRLRGCSPAAPSVTSVHTSTTPGPARAPSSCSRLATMADQNQSTSKKDSFSGLANLMWAKTPHPQREPSRASTLTSLSGNSKLSAHAAIGHTTNRLTGIAEHTENGSSRRLPCLQQPSSIMDVLDWMGSDPEGHVPQKDEIYDREPSREDHRGRVVESLEPEKEDLSEELAEAQSELKELQGVTEIHYLRNQPSTLAVRPEEQHDDVARKNQEHLDRILLHLDEQIKLSEESMPKESNTASLSKGPSNAALDVQALFEELAMKEQTIADLRQAQLQEQMRVVELEDELKAFKSDLSRDCFEDMKAELAIKTSQCDQLRGELHVAEQTLKRSQEQARQTSNNFELLRGAAHLVVPMLSGKLPRTVISCSECYANNLPCDSNTRCRNCRERDTLCARWNCSLKYRFGECPLTPCRLLHDSQGWLILKEARPQW
ncbi:hypothetical protein IQ07DRAFT_37486 [Pyrenochaeta sp. DS3sAY3a]|nr:hypothetical protein IQ07DRAFT_37486 [Pyrenochaeta sp. DS3sAY3a]